MAVTRLADVLVPSVWASYLSEKTAQLTALILSGAVAINTDLSTKLRGGGRTFDFPFWKDLGTPAANVSSDDPASPAVPNKITTGDQIVARLQRNNPWSGMDITGTLAGSDPMAEIASKLTGYWARHDQGVVISILKGLEADNVANYSSDLVHNVYQDLVTVTTGALTVDHVIDAKGLMGDAGEMFTTIIMHSVIKKSLDKMQVVKTEYVDTPGAARLVYQTYLGMRIVVDDECPAVAGTNQTAYTTYLVKSGAFQKGEGVAPIPLEQEREALQGDGGGQDILVSRREIAFHPVGYAMDATFTLTPTNAQLELASSWTRVFEKKNTGIVILKTNA